MNLEAAWAFWVISSFALVMVAVFCLGQMPRRWAIAYAAVAAAWILPVLLRAWLMVLAS